MVQIGKYNQIPKHFSNELVQIIDLCLTNDPNKRPTASEILARYPFTEPGGTPTSVTDK